MVLMCYKICLVISVLREKIKYWYKQGYDLVRQL